MKERRATNNMSVIKVIGILVALCFVAGLTVVSYIPVEEKTLYLLAIWMIVSVPFTIVIATTIFLVRNLCDFISFITNSVMESYLPFGRQ